MRLPSLTCPAAGVRKAIILCAIAAAIVAVAAPNALAAFSGAIYTSLGDGTVVNQNLYDQKSDVYLNGGPQNVNAKGLPDGTYYFQVTDPSGSVLLSSDNAVCRQLQVVGGAVAGAVGPCPHANGTLNPVNNSTPVQLIPFADTSNSGGEYKVWLIPVAAATIDGVDPRILIFDGGNSKTDNFKVTQPEVTGSTISGMKFYDVNVNGVLDPGEVGIAGWKIEIDVPSNTTTDSNGNYEFLNLDPGTYEVCEVIPALAPTWVPTTATSIPGITVPPDSPNNNFGNVCLGDGGGKTLGYWSNKNGEKTINTLVPGGLNYLSALRLRKADGGLAQPFGSYTAFRSWILGATATNMAYMLSAQLAAMKLNVGAGFVQGGAIVYAGTCGNTGINNAFITINDLMTNADNQLATHPITTSALDPVNRAIQECLKNTLDAANNNQNFVQAAPCDVNYSGLETSCLVP